MSIKRSRGMTLIELVIAIVVIGIGVAGVMMAFSTVVKNSADPLVRKQMLSIAEEMMEEITLKPFAVSGTAPTNTLKNCTFGAGVASRANFDDVSDFNAYQTTGICNIDGDAVVPLSAYNLQVTVTTTNAMDGVVIAAGRVKKITVTVIHGSDALTLVGWRVNYAT